MRRTTIPLAACHHPGKYMGKHTLALFAPIACVVACLTKPGKMLTDCLAVTHRADPHVP